MTYDVRPDRVNGGFRVSRGAREYLVGKYDDEETAIAVAIALANEVDRAVKAAVQ